MDLQNFDARRQLFVGQNSQEALAFAVSHLEHVAKRSIQQRGRFAMALAGGKTPHPLYLAFAQSRDVDWSRIWLFWGDERPVPPDHPESNYRMAMEVFGALPIPKGQIFRMHAEREIEKGALQYEETLRHHLGRSLFDLVFLGMGEDGHIASLFHNSSALNEKSRLVVPNFIPSLSQWRMTLTFPCIQQSHATSLFVLGSQKAPMVAKVLEAPLVSAYPASQIGTEEHPALWILDSAAASLLPQLKQR